MSFDREMQKALEADGEKLQQLTGADHGPVFEDYADPTTEMLDGDPLFEAIWRAIKDWDISRHNNGLYSGPTGNDVRHIYDAIQALATPVTSGDRNTK